MPRIISMVPSWTETLVRAGVTVVGRTRFCIHPAPEVSKIPAVGGTKDVDWSKVDQLSADFILLDREENPKSMAEQSPIPVVVTHIKSLLDVARDCETLASEFSNNELRKIAERWRKICKPLKHRSDFNNIPGIVKWLRPPQTSIQSFVYVIWKNPWMAVSRATFIGSVFENLGYGDMMMDFDKPYVEIDLQSLDPSNVCLLFSTEPYPFGKKPELLTRLPHASAIINGESYSWFGIRSLEFLESVREARG